MNLCDPSNKSYRAVVTHGIVYAVQGAVFSPGFCLGESQGPLF